MVGREWVAGAVVLLFNPQTLTLTMEEGTSSMNKGLFLIVLGGIKHPCNLVYLATNEDEGKRWG